MKWSALVLVAYLGFPLCTSLVKRIRPQEYLAIQTSCEKWFVIFINSWCWNTLLIDDFVFRLRNLMYNLEGVANIGVVDGVADAAFYSLFGYGGVQFVQLIDPPCSNVPLLRNPNVRNLLPYFDSEKITRELVSLVRIYEQDGCKLQGDFRFAFISTNKPPAGCLVSLYGLNKQQPTRFSVGSNGMKPLYGVPSFLDDYRSRYRPCSTILWKPVDLYDVMTSCKFWIIVSVAQESDWPCVREIEKFAVYSKDNFDFGYVKGPTFGVWLFMENKLTPEFAMSDPMTCQVPAMFDIIKRQLTKVLPPPGQVCNNFASSQFDVDGVAILNQKKLLESCDIWLVLQASPLSSDFLSIYNEFKILFNQLKGSFRFGFIPNSNFGLRLYGSKKNWPYLITSDTNDFLSERYMAMLLDITNRFGPHSAPSSPLSPYAGSPLNLKTNLQQQASATDQYYQNGGSLNLGSTPQVGLLVSRSLENNDNSNAIMNTTPTGRAVPVPLCSKSCNKTESRSLGENKVYNGARGLEILNDDGASEEFILEPVFNLSSFPEKWKAGLDELFTHSKDLVVRVSFPYPNRRKKTEEVKPMVDGARSVDEAQFTSSTSETALSSVSPASPIEVERHVETTPVATEPPVNLTTDIVVEPSTGVVVLPLSTMNDVSTGLGTRELSETTTQTSVESPTETTVQTSVESPTETTTQTSVESPTETTTQKSVESPTETTTQKSVESQAETTTQTSVESQVETTTQASVESQAETTAQKSVESQAETTTQTSVESQAASTTQTSVESQAENTAQTIVESQTKTAAQTSVGSQTETTAQTSVGSQAETTAQTSVESQAETTTQLSVESQAETTAQTSVESQTETVATAAEMSTEATSAGSLDLISQSPQTETSVAPTEASAASVAFIPEGKRTIEASTEASVDVGVSASAEMGGRIVTESPASNATEAVVTEAPAVAVPTAADSEAMELTQSTAAIQANYATQPTTEGTATEVSSTLAAQSATTERIRRIETTDVETVRKDCKFWVLISSSETKETNELYDKCYEKLAGIMSNYKSVYKFGAVQTGEFFINLYLRNKSNPIVITMDYACDEKTIKSALDAHMTEIPGEFCQDPEDEPNILTSVEPVTAPTRSSSTVAPDCSLQLVVRYPKKDASKYQSCLGELSKVIKSKEANWQVKEEDKPVFSILLWTTTGVKPLTNLKLADCSADAIETGINNVVTINSPMCAYARWKRQEQRGR